VSREVEFDRAVDAWLRGSAGRGGRDVRVCEERVARPYAAIDEAEYAVLDAALARKEADELAAV
jgi:hypothetical protein